jgi:hypothetical protein
MSKYLVPNSCRMLGRDLNVAIPDRLLVNRAVELAVDFIGPISEVPWSLVVILVLVCCLEIDRIVE